MVSNAEYNWRLLNIYLTAFFKYLHINWTEMRLMIFLFSLLIRLTFKTTLLLSK